MDQLQSRLAYMEDEKTRLITAAKNKNEQVQLCTIIVCHPPDPFWHDYGA